MNKIKYLIVFTIGAVVYPFIEILWRGYSHWSMELAGGLSLLSIYCLNETSNCSLFIKCIISMVIITFIELITGLIFNCLLNWNIWDYSNVPLNFMGQICLPYMGIWLILSYIILRLCKTIKLILIKLNFA